MEWHHKWENFRFPKYNTTMPRTLPCSRRQEEGPAAIVVVGRGLVALVLGGGGHGVRDDADFSDF